MDPSVNWASQMSPCSGLTKREVRDGSCMQTRLKEVGTNRDMKPSSLICNDGIPEVSNQWLWRHMQFLRIISVIRP
jgi:hypothetical protein